MDVPSDLAVIRAHLPYVDRRALSEAWYAALRLEQMGSKPVKALQPNENGPAKALEPEELPGSQRKATRSDVTQKPAVSRRRREVARGAPETTKRSPQERARDARPVAEPRAIAATNSIAVSFTVTVGDARVRVVARGNANRLHLAAVCSARHVDMVRRALAHATLGLRQQGALVDSNLHCHEELQ